MSSQSSAGHSWTYTAISVLAGLGAGYLIGLISARLMWKKSPPQRQRPRTPTRTGNPELIGALNSLAGEVGRLREAVEGNKEGVLSASRGRAAMRPVESSSEFVSARSESDDDDEFFEFTTPFVNGASPAEATPPNDQYASLDEQGKSSGEDEEACTTLIEQIRSRLGESPDDVGLLWRLARALTHLSLHKEKQEETEREKELLQQAIDYGRQALDIDDSCWQAHQWYASALGSSIKHQGTQQKIQLGNEYKEHIDTAISLNPDNPTLHYLRGRYCYEVSGLSWLEKKAVAALFASPPEATYDESLQCFMRAEELNPGKWKSNLMMVAKCHIKLGDTPTAVDWLNRGYDLPTITADDETSQREIGELLLEHDENFMA